MAAITIICIAGLGSTESDLARVVQHAQCRVNMSRFLLILTIKIRVQYST
jgi:hypothetical protein